MSWILTFSRRGGGDVECPGPDLILYDDPHQLTRVNFVLLGRRLVLLILPSVARLAWAEPLGLRLSSPLASISKLTISWSWPCLFLMISRQTSPSSDLAAITFLFLCLFGLSLVVHSQVHWWRWPVPDNEDGWKISRGDLRLMIVEAVLVTKVSRDRSVTGAVTKGRVTHVWPHTSHVSLLRLEAGCGHLTWKASLTTGHRHEARLSLEAGHTWQWGQLVSERGQTQGGLGW